MSNSYEAFITSLNSSSVSKNILVSLTYLKWKEIIDDEMKALYCGTWDMVALPKGKCSVIHKWVTINYKANGFIKRYIARYVTKWYTQIYGID